MLEERSAPSHETGDLPVSVFGSARDLYNRYEVELSFTDILIGGTPGSPDVIEAWLRKNTGVQSDEEIQAMMVRTLSELEVDVSGDMNMEDLRRASEGVAHLMHTTVFKRDGNGLFIEGRHVMAMLKESVSVLYTGKKWGYRPPGKLDNGSKGKAATSYFAERVHVPEPRIYLGRNEPDGIEQRPVRPQNPQIPTSLKAFEYVEKPVITFTIEEMRDTVPEGEWARIWYHAERNGLGAMRSQQSGKFVVTRWELAGA